MANHYIGQERKGIEKGLGKNTEWTEQELAVKADKPLIDVGSGKKVIIRKFDFTWNKDMSLEKKIEAQSNKQAFFNWHARYIRDFLWKDGLSILEHEDPKMIFNAKGYSIAVACEAKFGVSIFERGSTLQDIIHPKKK